MEKKMNTIEQALSLAAFGYALLRGQEAVSRQAVAMEFK
jgi:hypothetical protein